MSWIVQASDIVFTVTSQFCSNMIGPNKYEAKERQTLRSPRFELIINWFVRLHSKKTPQKDKMSVKLCQFEWKIGLSSII